MGKRGKKIPFDEAFEVGPFQFGRAGRFMVIKNSMSQEEILKYREGLSNEYPRVIKKIDKLVFEIRNLVASQNPLHLLNRAYFEFLMAHVGKRSSVELGPEENMTIRVLEYVQSVFASTQINCEESPDLDKVWGEITGKIQNLYDFLNQSYFSCRTAQKNSENITDNALEHLMVQLEMNWLSVRSDRNHVNEIPHLTDFLSPHDQALKDCFGIGFEEVITGLQQLQHNLSRGTGENLEHLENIQDSLFRRITELEEVEPENFWEMLEKHKDKLQELGLFTGLDEILSNLFEWELFNVKKATKWPEELIRRLSWEIGEDKKFFAPGELSGWPLRVMPIFKRPFLIIDGVSYCFDQINLFDNFYRQLEQVLCDFNPKYRNIWNKKQKDVSERLPSLFLGSILTGAETHNNVFYRDDEAWPELDTIILFGDTLFVIEVKAGAFSKGAPTTNIRDYLNSIKKLITRPAGQAYRFLNLLDEKGELEIFDHKHRPLAKIKRKDLRLLVPMCVTLDNITHIAARSSTLGEVDENLEKYPVWSIAIDDLRVFEKIFRDGNIFCHFVEQRMKAVVKKAIPVVDEMEHLGLYFRENMYAEVLTNKFSLDTKSSRKPKNPIFLHGYSDLIDTYFYNLYSDPNREPPRQNMPPRFYELIRALDLCNTTDSIYASRLLLNFSTAARRDLVKRIDDIYKRTLDKGRIFALNFVNSEAGFTFIKRTKDLEINLEDVTIETQAELYRQAPSNRILFDFQTDGERINRCNVIVLRKEEIKSEELPRIEEISEAQSQRRIQATGRRKIGRNEFCPCGSGKKWKKCHGN